MFKRIAISFLLVLMTLSFSLPAMGGAFKPQIGDFQDFMNRVGVELLDSATKLNVGDNYSGKVSNPDKFKTLGFTNVNKGDKVKVQILDGGRSKLMLLSTGQEKTVTIK